ncbi:MAG: hypothetical protein C4B59_17725, partial [Candidatus Methanogaster sp.]
RKKFLIGARNILGNRFKLSEEMPLRPAINRNKNGINLVGSDEHLFISPDFNWLQTKLEAIDVNSIIRDYDYLPDDHNASLVQNAIQMSAHVLSRDKTQLSGQLLGRL